MENHAFDLIDGRAEVSGLVAESIDALPIVPGTPQLLNAATERADLIRYAENLARAASKRILLVDTAQGLGLAVTRAALLAADLIIIPMQAEPAVRKRSYPEVLTLLRLFRSDAALSTRFRIDPELLFVPHQMQSAFEAAHR